MSVSPTISRTLWYPQAVAGRWCDKYLGNNWQSTDKYHIFRVFTVLGIPKIKKNKDKNKDG